MIWLGDASWLEQPSAEIKAFFEAERLPIDKLQVVAHNFSPEAFIKGEVDAISAYISDEAFVLNEAGMEYLIFDPKTGGIDFYGDVLFTSQAQIDAAPEKVKAFVEASLLGWRYAMQNPDEIIDLILSKYSQRHSRAHLKYEAEQMQRLIIPKIVEIGYMNPGRWQHIAETFISQGMMPADFNLDGFIYDRYQQPDYRKLLLSALVIILAGLVIFIAASFYLRYVRRKNQEMIARLEAEERYNNLLSRYQHLIENAPFPMLITAVADGKLLYYNPAAATFFGIKSDSNNPMLMTDFYANVSERLPFLSKIESEGHVKDYELQYKNTAGKEIWASVNVVAITFDNQSALFASLIDVTERVRARAELKELSDRLQLITDNMQDVIWLFDLQTRRLRYISPSVYSMRGYTPEEVMAQTIDEWLTTEARENFANWLKGLQNMTDDEITSDSSLLRIDQPHRDGSIVPTEVTARLVFDASGNAVQVVGVSRDIRERIRAENEKIRLERKLQQLKKTESLSRLAGAVAHHFNNRLHGVLGSLEFSLDDIKQGIMPVDNIAAATDFASQAAELGALMLTYLGENLISTIDVDLEKFCKSTLAELQKKPPENILFEHAATATPVPVKANPEQLRQVIANLYTNAVEAIGTREGVIRTAVCAVGRDAISSVDRYPVDWEAEEAHYGSFEITDNGSGIHRADLERIFDPFFTTRFTGRGLGLAVALGIIKNHGGGITVTSEPGKGSSFKFYLPLH
ncbi:MAG: hypothetical protein CVV41_18180 [Candidatus Riflebacteria bacterium HGW-Riflebacteria-1]|jgi:PAS domain S-box-containing protein|nr:MAG: hypothetical protein CVV41_18180 [Candidatus Riflebacteria bacterium HGW-Riflebacteria-1]